MYYFLDTDVLLDLRDGNSVASLCILPPLASSDVIFSEFTLFELSSYCKISLNEVLTWILKICPKQHIVSLDAYQNKAFRRFFSSAQLPYLENPRYLLDGIALSVSKFLANEFQASALAYFDMYFWECVSRELHVKNRKKLFLFRSTVECVSYRIGASLFRRLSKILLSLINQGHFTKADAAKVFLGYIAFFSDSFANECIRLRKLPFGRRFFREMQVWASRFIESMPSVPGEFSKNCLQIIQNNSIQRFFHQEKNKTFYKECRNNFIYSRKLYNTDYPFLIEFDLTIFDALWQGSFPPKNSFIDASNLKAFYDLAINYRKQLPLMIYLTGDSFQIKHYIKPSKDPYLAFSFPYYK